MKQLDYDKSSKIAGGAILAVSLFFILFSFIWIVPVGTVGIVDVFGKVNHTERMPGLNLVNSFVKLVVFNIKTEEVKEVMTVPSKEGLTVRLDVSVFYRVKQDKASDIYSTVGGGIS